MPSFHETLKEKPQTTWNLVAYVLRVADSRREGAMPDSGLLEDGLLKPLPGIKPGSSAPAPAPQHRHRRHASRAAESRPRTWWLATA